MLPIDERRKRDRERQQKRRDSDHAAANERAKRFYWKHRDRIRSKLKALRKADPAKAYGPLYRWRSKNPDKNAAIKKRSYEKNKEQLLSRHKIYRDNIRQETLQHYGGKCACCGESIYEFLALDHINNDGKQHRLIAGVGAAFCIWLKKNGYPSNIQILCHNCNQAKNFYGCCPHHPLKKEGADG